MWTPCTRENQFPFWQLIHIDSLIKTVWTWRITEKNKKKYDVKKNKSSCWNFTVSLTLIIWNYFFPNSHSNHFMDSLIWIAAKNLGNQPPGHNRFIIFLHCMFIGKGRGDRLLFGKLILRDSSILNPLRDTLFLWLDWFLEQKLTEKKNPDKTYWVLLQHKRSRHLEMESSQKTWGDNQVEKCPEIPSFCVLSL